MSRIILKTSDGRIYHCTDCPYSDRETGFCGFCMRKVMDDVKGLKNTKKEASGSGIQVIGNEDRLYV